MPEAAGFEYVAELQRRWPELGMKDNWEGRLDFQRAEQMVRKLALYVLDMREAGRSLLAVERTSVLTLRRPPASRTRARTARLRGQVDRLEIDADRAGWWLST